MTEHHPLWYDTAKIDAFRDNDIDNLSNYINLHRVESLQFAEEAFGRKEEESYVKAIRCMTVHSGSVPSEVLQFALEDKDSEISFEALLYLEKNPMPSLEQNLTKYLEKILKEKDVSRYEIEIEVAVSGLVKTGISSIKEKILREIKGRKDVFKSIPKDIQRSINILLKNVVKIKPQQPAYTKLIHNHHRHAV
ncbi:hypothetical protein HON22_01340 [Candidatus Peregrinibacteria bacterium]|jgi:hypothetical protein|nr:hypothetical protein [Candidatus Peregrinibacteria bacterium]